MRGIPLRFPTLIALALIETGVLQAQPSALPPTFEPETIQMQPGETARLPRLTVIPLPPRQGVPPDYLRQDVPVVNLSDQVATVVSDGQVFRITLPAGFTVRADVTAIRYESDGTYTALGQGTACRSEPGSSHVAVCNMQGGVTRPVSVQFTATRTSQNTEAVTLSLGCNNVSLTWPNNTSSATVAAAVRPSGTLTAIWRFDAARGRFVGFAPLFPREGDLSEVSRLDAVFLCMSGPGTLMRPAL